MSLRSYAKLLGLAPNENGLISKKDIRCAYIMLAKQLHPDKGAVDSSEFVHIKEAYDKLLGACGENEYVFIGSEFQFDALLSLVSNLASRLKKHFDEAKSNTHATYIPSPPTTIKLRVKIKELYEGSWKKIKYKYLTSDGTYQSDEVYICLESYQEEYLFPEKGDVVNGTHRTSLKVTLDIETDDVMYVDTIFMKHDICFNFTVSLYEYYYRNAFYIEYFGEVIEIKYSPGLSLQTIPGKGLPFVTAEGSPTRGDLVVFFKLVLPKVLPQTIEPIIQEHFGLSTVQKTEGELQST